MGTGALQAWGTSWCSDTDTLHTSIHSVAQRDTVNDVAQGFSVTTYMTN